MDEKVRKQIYIKLFPKADTLNMIDVSAFLYAVEKVEYTLKILNQNLICGTYGIM